MENFPRNLIFWWVFLIEKWDFWGGFDEILWEFSGILRPQFHASNFWDWRCFSQFPQYFSPKKFPTERPKKTPNFPWISSFLIVSNQF